MKAKITKPDGTVIELEGDVMELSILLEPKTLQVPKAPSVPPSTP